MFEIISKLLSSEALHFKTKPEEFYTWTSGLKSPIYCNNRLLLSNPLVRDIIVKKFCNLIQTQFSTTNCIAGVSTAGIPWASFIANDLKLPLIYVRPEPKKHGLKNQIEGKICIGNRVVIIEDLISTGKSSLGVAKCLKNSGLMVNHIFSIFQYNLNSTNKIFIENDFNFSSLTDFLTLCQYLKENKCISTEELKVIENWYLELNN